MKHKSIDLFHIYVKIIPLLLFIVLSTISIKVYSQVKVTGTLMDERKNPVEDVSIQVYRSTAETVHVFKSNKNGNFQIKINLGNSRIRFSHLKYKDVERQIQITGPEKNINLGIIQLQDSVISLSELLIKRSIPKFVQKGDTLEYDAKAYKVLPNDRVFELLRKLYGISIDAKGNVFAHGEQVNKILIEGKAYYGNDIRAALVNLPADAINKVQILRGKSEESRKTGIDDGKSESIINLTIKEEKKDGRFFGNAQIQVGTKERYLGNISLNSFKNQKQLAVYGISNNINKSVFSLDEFLDEGLIKNNSLGFSLANKHFNDKVDLNLSYNFTKNQKSLDRTSEITDPTNEGIFFTSQEGKRKSTDFQHSAFLSIQYSIDSLTSVTIEPNVVFNLNKSTNNELGHSLLNNVPMNKNEQKLSQRVHHKSISAALLLNRKLKNKKGNFNFSINIKDEMDNGNNSNKIHLIQLDLNKDSLTDQSGQLDQKHRIITSSMGLNRTLNQQKDLKANIKISYFNEYNNTDQTTFLFNPISSFYDILIHEQSSHLKNYNDRFMLNFGLSKGTGNFNYSISTNFANVIQRLNTLDKSKVEPYKKTYYTVLPDFRLSYQINKHTRINLTGASNVSLPSIHDINPIINNSNSLFRKMGNPNLKLSQSFKSSINLLNSNSTNQAYNSIIFYHTKKWNSFSTATSIDKNTGVQTIMPINVHGYNLFEFQLGKGAQIINNKLDYLITFDMSHESNSARINDSVNKIKRSSIGGGLKLSHLSDQFEIETESRFSYNQLKNSFKVSSENNLSYNYLNNYLRMAYLPFSLLKLQSSLYYNLYQFQETSQTNNSQILLNSAIEYNLKKNDKITISANVFDLLNQNENLKRQISNTGRIENYSTNNLDRYFYLSLIYKIK